MKHQSSFIISAVLTILIFNVLASGIYLQTVKGINQTTTLQLQNIGGGQTTLSNEYTHNSPYAAKLVIPPNAPAGSGCMALYPYNKTLNSLRTFQIETSYNNAVPRFVVLLDTNGDGTTDLVLLSDYQLPSNGSWQATQGGLRWGWTEATPQLATYGKTWNDLDYWTSIYGNVTALSVGVALEYWAVNGTGGLGQPLYADELTLNGVTYNIATTPTQSPTESNSDNWSMYRHDEEHSGLSSSPVSNGMLLWKYYTGLSGGDSVSTRLRSSPAVVDGIVYFATNNSCFCALNATSGSLIWRVNTASIIDSSPAFVDGVVYIGLLWTGQSGYVEALNATDGSIIWQFATNSGIESSPAVVNEIVYIGSYNGYIYALNANNGALIWSYLTGGETFSSPAIVNGVVYIGSLDGKIYALNADNGALIWAFQARNAVWSSPAVINGTLYFNTDNGTVIALNTIDGSQKWQSYIGCGTDHADDSPAVANGIVYVGTRNGYYALNATDGSQIWFFTSPYTPRELTGYVYSSPVVTCNVVYYGSDDGYVFALNASNGTMIWSYQTGLFVFASPAIANGVLYVASYDGNVYALGAPIVSSPTPSPTATPEPTPPTSPSSNPSAIDNWTMYRHDPQRTGISTSPAPTPTLLWKYYTGISGDSSVSTRLRSSPAVVNGIVYFATNNSYFCALNAYTGSVIWRVSTINVVDSSPAVVGGIVYFGILSINDNSCLDALNATDGSVIWQYNGIGIESSPAVVNGVVYVGDYYGTVHALNATSGVSIWKYPLGGCAFSSPAVIDKVVYIGSTNGIICAINATNGDLIWSIQTGNPIWSSPCVVNGIVYFSTDNGTVMALHTFDGSEIWQSFIGAGTDHVGDSPAVANGAVYIGDRNGYYALNATDGSKIWYFISPYSAPFSQGFVYSSPAVVGNTVYFGYGDGYTFAINASTGTMIWAYQTGWFVFASPAIYDGVLYIDSYDGNVYALGTTTQPTQTPSTSPTVTAQPTATPTPRSTTTPNLTATPIPTATPLQAFAPISTTQPIMPPVFAVNPDGPAPVNWAILGAVVIIGIIASLSLPLFFKNSSPSSENDQPFHPNRNEITNEVIQPRNNPKK